jgi:hypothetical protein
MVVEKGPPTQSFIINEFYAKTEAWVHVGAEQLLTQLAAFTLVTDSLSLQLTDANVNSLTGTKYVHQQRIADLLTWIRTDELVIILLRSLTDEDETWSDKDKT